MAREFELIAKLCDDKAFGLPVCEANRHLLGDTWEAQVKVQQWHPPLTDVFFGNPPCSAFSALSAGMKWRGVSSAINECMWQFIHAAAQSNATIVTMESVRGAYGAGYELMRQLWDTLERETRHKYTCYHVLVTAGDFEVSQATRRRYFLVLSRVNIPWQLPPLRPIVIMADALGDLVDVPAGGADGHVIPKVAHTWQPRIAELCEVGWPMGYDYARQLRRYYAQTKNLPAWELRREMKLLDSEFRAAQWGVSWYRGRWQQSAHTVTGAGFVQVHPLLSRTLTHREIARLVGFPDTWQLDAVINAPQQHATYGKGVCPPVAAWLAAQLRRALEVSEAPAAREVLVDVASQIRAQRKSAQFELMTSAAELCEIR
jgi:site-specific DNA-cytosine methylase